jgi:dTDP-4-dehydrorhamnose 3,5-epimerase
MAKKIKETRLNFATTPLQGLIIIEPNVFHDDRGYFLESFQKKLFQQNGMDVEFVQDNISFSVKGTCRGLHFQRPPHGQGKLVRVTQGAVYDVAVDIRRDSPTFGLWFGLELSEASHKALYIPQGFAHGFSVLSDTAQFTYKCTDYYTPQCERGIIWNDPTINVQWPILGVPIVSPKDLQLPKLAFADINFNW